MSKFSTYYLHFIKSMQTRINIFFHEADAMKVHIIVLYSVDIVEVADMHRQSSFSVSICRLLKSSGSDVKHS